VRASGYIRIDETPVQVINSEKSASSEHWMWIRVAGPPRHRIILFDYDASRSGEVASRLLEGAYGTIQSDGYSAYDQVAQRYGLIHCGCLAHARRRFFEAIKALPKKEQKTVTAAHEAVRRIDELYTIERDAKALTDAQRTAVRKAKSVPLLEALHTWASGLQQSTLPSGKLGEALAYLLKHYAERRTMPNGCSPRRRRSALHRTLYPTPTRATRHSLPHYKVPKNCSRRSSTLKRAGLELSGLVLASASSFRAK
jgi:transposase